MKIRRAPGCPDCRLLYFQRRNTLSNILLTGGRAPVTLELARQFHAAGHTVFVAESLPWHVCRGSRAVARSFRVPPPNRQPRQFIAALQQIIRRQRVDVLVPTCEETFFVAMGRRSLCESCVVFTAGIEQLRRLHNKFTFAQTARRYGLPVPATRLLTNPAAARTLVGKNMVLKPAYSRFATQTIIRPRAASQIPAGISPTRPWVAQDFAAGPLLCTSSVAHRGRMTAHADYAAEFSTGAGGAVAFAPAQNVAARRWVTEFVAREQFTGQISFDFIQTGPGRVTAIECNPRATSGLHLFGPALANAYLHPDLPTLEPPDSAAKMVAPAMLWAGLGAARVRRGFRGWWNSFSRSRDVIFSPADPLPGLAGQWLSLGYFLWQSARRRIGPVAATTADIEWNGEAMDNEQLSIINEQMDDMQ